MQSSFIKYILTNEVVHALFRTLVHSLWQAILLALIAAIILVRTKKSGAALRYKLLSIILLSFVFISIATFCYELNAVNNDNNTSFKNVSPVLANSSLSNSKQEVSFAEKIISVFQPAENFIVLLWFIIILLKFINLLTGLRSIYLLRRRQVFNVGEYWNYQLKALAAKAGVTKHVRLLKSAIVKVPMVLGHLKPVILFPASALTSLASEEIEAILLHELAHIRRKDYLINMLQSLAEIIFFFNPAVLWISSLIKEERENCCDDIAVEQIKNKKQFIHALVSFQEYNLDIKYAASFSGRRNYLLNRIRRIVTNNNKTLNNMEKILLTAGIIVTCCAVFAFSKNKQLSVTNATTLQAAKTFVSSNKNDTVPEIVNNNESKYSISTSMDGKQYRLVEVNGKVTELYVNNTRIPDDKIPAYNSVINKLHEKVKADKQQQAEEMQAQKEALTAQANEMKEDMMNRKEEIEKQAEEMNVQAKKLQEEMMKQKDITMKDQSEKLAEIMKEKSVMMKDQAEKLKEMIDDQVEKQSEIMNGKSKIINEDMERQIEDLKKENEMLKQQLKQKMDSIYHAKPTEPTGA